MVGVGTPEELIRVDGSYTGKFLKPIMERDKARARGERVPAAIAQGSSA
ncbi:hypothetical protein GCM10025857_16220 [Alicyclobacillus contaminans]|nr:hypothetical protein GCM10025857_16220 [Alicyclobacillus contaminans]